VVTTAANRHVSTLRRGGDLLAEQRRSRVLVSRAVSAIARGQPVIVTGDRRASFVPALVAGVDRITPPALNFMITHGRGPLFAALEAARLEGLGLELIRPHARGDENDPVHVPVDHRAGTTTGLSAADRVATVRALADPASRPGDFRVPGHVFPVGARAGGVLEQLGHTEAAVDLARLGGLSRAALTCPILAEDGTMATLDQTHAFAAHHGLVVLQIADIATYRRDVELVVERVGQASLPIPEGRFLAVGYSDRYERGEHMALIVGELRDPGPVMIRVHADCLSGDVFGSLICGCRAELQRSIEEIAEHGRGVLIYIRTPGGDRGRLRHLDPALDPALLEADRKAAATAISGVALSMLKDLGVTSRRLAGETSA
jgi:3,4-dihydroxy 2-butanone 4-phosphate synthase/GTP cyclohydrolase II